MRVVHLVYQVASFAICDVYLQGKIVDVDEAIHDATTTLLKIRDNPAKKFSVIVFESNKPCYATGPKIMRQRGLFKLEHQIFHSVERFEASRKTVDRIKMLLLDESYKVSKKRIIVDSSDGSDYDVPNSTMPAKALSSDQKTPLLYSKSDKQQPTIVSTYHDKPPSHVPSTIPAKVLSSGQKTPPSHSKADGQQPTIVPTYHDEPPSQHKSDIDDVLREMCVQGSVLHIEEAIINIKSLISINFLKLGDFYITGDKAILKRPCVFAYGDFITGRNDFHLYKRDGWLERITRLSEYDLLVS